MSVAKQAFKVVWPYWVAYAIIVGTFSWYWAWAIPQAALIVIIIVAVLTPIALTDLYYTCYQKVKRDRSKTLH